MIEFFLSVLSSVIGNLVTPSFKGWIGFKDGLPKEAPPPQSTIPDSEDEEALEQQRRYIRNQWAIRSWTFFVFFVLIFFVSTALTFPLALKTGFFSHPLSCDKTLAASLCVGAYWDVGTVKTLLVLIIIPCTIMIWLLAQTLANPIAYFIHHNRQHVGPILYKRILGLTIMFLAFILCGHWIYFLYPSGSYLTSITLPFLIVGMFGAFTSGQR